MNAESNLTSPEENKTPEPAPTPAPETEVVSPQKIKPKSERLRSLDALRGFDMFWIVGGEVLVHKLAHYTQWPWMNWLGGELRHVKWEGFQFYDLIFPLFLFLAGVALPYSLGRQLEKGAPKWRLLLKIGTRVALLIALGVIYNGGLALKPLAETRVFSVLGLIGIAYGIAAVIYLYTPTRTKPITLAACAAGILLGYWAALSWIPVPDIGAGVITAKGSLSGFIDRELFPWRLHTPNFDPEGFLPSLAASAVALMGALTGHLLRNIQMPPLRKGLIMLAAGLLALGVAHLWGQSLPIVKNMWTSSFMLHCAGWSLIFLSVFYLIIDVLGVWRWSFFFIVIGMNPILIYLATRIMPLQHTSNFFFGGIINKFAEEPMHAWLGALAYIITWWVALHFLYRRKCFLRV